MNEFDEAFLKFVKRLEKMEDKQFFSSLGTSIEELKEIHNREQKSYQLTEFNPFRPDPEVIKRRDAFFKELDDIPITIHEDGGFSLQ